MISAGTAGGAALACRLDASHALQSLPEKKSEKEADDDKGRYAVPVHAVSSAPDVTTSLSHKQYVSRARRSTKQRGVARRRPGIAENSEQADAELAKTPVQRCTTPCCTASGNAAPNRSSNITPAR